MSGVDVKDRTGSVVGSFELDARIFDTQINVPVMHQVVLAQMAAARSGTASTRTRANVSGGGKKPWKQKGTGRARQGSIRAPQWVGGGVVFGPHPRDYTQRVPKKMKVLALHSALTDRARLGDLIIVDSFEMEEPKTRVVRELLAAVGAGGRVLLVVEGIEDNAIKSFRNLPRVHLIGFDQLNTYDVLRSDVVVFSKASLDAFQQRGRRAARTGVDEVPAEAEAQSAAPEAAAGTGEEG
ncbi:MAG: 50S ribosomal protein L4 [Actinomycetota bacterium]